MTTSASINVSAYVHRQRPLWNAIAIAYILLSYIGAIALLLLPNGWLNGVGVVLLTHSLVCSAYLSHEFMHSTIFQSRKANAAWGTIMLWLNGGCYARFDDLAKFHIAHHTDRVDFSSFELATTVRSLPAPLYRTLLILEWLYIPALSFWLQWRSLTAPFWQAARRQERARVLAILLIRGALFGALAWVAPKALLLYAIAYIGMITLLRWQDAFQHTYELFPVGTAVPMRDRAHEQANTFSTLLSQRYPWINVLLLNFGYHNAHHVVMKCPWHALPDLDRELFSGQEVHYIPLRQQIANYHQFRLDRIFLGQGHAVNAAGQPTPETFYGAVGVSMLVLSA